MFKLKTETLTPKILARAEELFELLGDAKCVVADAYGNSKEGYELRMDFDLTDPRITNETMRKLVAFFNFMSMQKSVLARTVFFDDYIFVVERMYVNTVVVGNTCGLRLHASHVFDLPQLKAEGFDFWSPEGAAEDFDLDTAPEYYTEKIEYARKHQKSLADFRKKSSYVLTMFRSSNVSPDTRFDFAAGQPHIGLDGKLTFMLGVRHADKDIERIRHPIAKNGGTRIKFVIHNNQAGFYYGKGVASLRAGVMVEVVLEELIWQSEFTYPEDVRKVKTVDLELDDDFVREIVNASAKDTALSIGCRQIPFAIYEKDELATLDAEKAKESEITTDKVAVPETPKAQPAIQETPEYLRMLEIVFRSSANRVGTVASAAYELNQFIDFIKSR